MSLRAEVRARRLRGDEGVALVELALFAPFLIFMVMGMMEFGLMWRDSITVTNSARAGARIGSNAADDNLADYSVVLNVAGALSDISPGDVRKLVIYEASGPNGQVPASCLTSSGPTCNLYTFPASASLLEADFGADGCVGGDPDDGWCPDDRDNTQVSTGAGDYLGVYVEVYRGYTTGLFPGGGLTLTDTAVMKIEPRYAGLNP
ncbi:MAG: pilus assembly protein [Actinomycetia bacterium]|nr:pilus assembly protein [Actinomycetes bacterium]MCP3911136.1 pilus assembly protein [Actinomycetes bacterium]